MEELLAGILGTGVQAYENYKNREYQKELQRQKQEAARRAGQQADITYNDIINILNDYNRGRISLADEPMVQQYKDLIANYEPQTYDFDKFQYTGKVEDFINPEAEKIAQLAGLETQAQLAGQGAAKGTGGLAGIGYSRWKAAEDLYKDAQAQYNAERSQAYKEYGDYITNMQNKLNTISQGQLAKANLLGGAIQNEQTQQSDYISSLINAMGDKAQANITTNLAAF